MLQVTFCKLEGVIWNYFNLTNLINLNRRNILLKNF